MLWVKGKRWGHSHHISAEMSCFYCMTLPHVRKVLWLPVIYNRNALWTVTFSPVSLKHAGTTDPGTSHPLPNDLPIAAPVTHQSLHETLTCSTRKDNSGSANRLHLTSPHPPARCVTVQYIPNPRGIQSFLRSWYLGERENQSIPSQAPVWSSRHTAPISLRLTADKHGYDLSHQKDTQQPPQNSHYGPASWTGFMLSEEPPSQWWNQTGFHHNRKYCWAVSGK